MHEKPPPPPFPTPIINTQKTDEPLYPPSSEQIRLDHIMLAAAKDICSHRPKLSEPFHIFCD